MQITIKAGEEEPLSCKGMTTNPDLQRTAQIIIRSSDKRSILEGGGRIVEDQESIPKVREAKQSNM